MQTSVSDPSQLAFYRRTFNRQLEPIKVMLVNRRHDLDYHHWLALIDRTRTSILNHPEQYVLINELAITEVRSMITRIFDEFVTQVACDQETT